MVLKCLHADDVFAGEPGDGGLVLLDEPRPLVILVAGLLVDETDQRLQLHLFHNRLQVERKLLSITDYGVVVEYHDLQSEGVSNLQVNQQRSRDENHEMKLYPHLRIKHPARLDWILDITEHESRRDVGFVDAFQLDLDVFSAPHLLHRDVVGPEGVDLNFRLKSERSLSIAS